MNWHVYIILCSDGSLYSGITTELERRFTQHAAGRGAKYFRGRQPLAVVYHESGHSRSSAGCREAVLKRLSRAAKLLLIASEKAKNLTPLNLPLCPEGYLSGETLRPPP